MNTFNVNQHMLKYQTINEKVIDKKKTIFA